MPYWRLHYHAVWSCKNRDELITPELEPKLYEYILGKGLELGGIMHAVGGIADHFHTTFSLAPKYALADACIKTSSQNRLIGRGDMALFLS